MAQGELTKDEAKACLIALEELFKALSKSKQMEYLGHMNDLSLFLREAMRELPS